eukprot:PITA_31442
MQKEYDALIKNEAWKLVDPPSGTKPIGCKWVYKNKYKVDGSLDKHKARLVAKGFAQKEGVDYEETFAPTAKWATIRTLFALAAQNRWKVHQGCKNCLLEWRSKRECLFGMTECNPLSTPMEQNLKLTSIEGKEFEDATKYRQLIGSLIYLTTTRPDISFAIGILSRFMQKPYFDGDKETRVSTSGYAMSLGLGAVSWRSHKQSVPADSTTEAEYVAAAEATKEIVWLRKILEDL